MNAYFDTKANWKCKSHISHLHATTLYCSVSRINHQYISYVDMKHSDVIWTSDLVGWHDIQTSSSSFRLDVWGNICLPLYLLLMLPRQSTLHYLTQIQQSITITTSKRERLQEFKVSKVNVNLYNASSWSTTSNALPLPVSWRWSPQANSTARHQRTLRNHVIRVGAPRDMPVYFPAFAGTKLYCLVTEAVGCGQLA